MAIPLLVAVTVGLAWLLSVGYAQLRVIDGVRETARAVARGDAEGEAVAAGAAVAPAGTTFSIRQGEDQVVVVGSGQVDGPGGLFRFLPAVTVSAEAQARAEPMTTDSE